MREAEGGAEPLATDRTKSFRGARTGSGEEGCIFSRLPLTSHLLCDYQCISKNEQTIRNVLLLFTVWWGVSCFASEEEKLESCSGGPVKCVTANFKLWTSCWCKGHKKVWSEAEHVLLFFCLFFPHSRSATFHTFHNFSERKFVARLEQYRKVISWGITGKHQQLKSVLLCTGG